MLIDQKEFLDQSYLLIVDMLRDADDAAKLYIEKMHEYLSDLLEYYNSVLQDIQDMLEEEQEKYEKEKDEKLKAIEKEKDARLKQIEDEKKAAIEANEAEEKALEGRIKKKQEEVDAIKKANEERKNEIDLQKKQYELMRAQYQRTNLVYKEGFANGGQLIYQADPNAISEKQQELDDTIEERRISKMEEEIELLEKQKDKISEKGDELEKYYDKLNDEAEDHYDKLTKETEEHYDAIIKKYEDMLEKWKEVAELQEKTERNGRLAALGIDPEAIMNGDTETLENFKDNYVGILADLYRESAEKIDALTELYKKIAPDSATLEKLSTFNESIIKEIQTRLGELQEGGHVNLLLRPEIDTNLLNQAGYSAGEGFATVFSSTFSNETGDLAINFTPIVVDPNTGEFLSVMEPGAFEQYCYDVVNGVRADDLNLQIGTAFTGADSLEQAEDAAVEIHNLHEKLHEYNEAMQDANEFTSELPSYLGKMQGELDQLSRIDLSSTEAAYNSLADGVKTIQDNLYGIDTSGAIWGFGDLKWAAEEALTDIGDAAGGAGGAVEDIGEKASKSFETTATKAEEAANSIHKITDAIGSGMKRKKATPAVPTNVPVYNELYDENGNSLVSVLDGVYSVGETAFDTLKEGADEAIQPVSTLVDITHKLAGGLKDIADGIDNITEAAEKSKQKGVYVTIAPSSLPKAHADGTVGSAFASGTSYNGLSSSEQGALRSEYGQPELTVYPNGTYEITTTPTISDLPKDTVIFNERQTKKILKNSGVQGKAHATGTNETLLPLAEAMPHKAEIFRRFEVNLEENISRINANVADMTLGMRDIAQNITNIANNSNVGNNVTFGAINVTCPGVTEAEVAKNIGGALRNELSGMFTGFALRADQKAMRR